MDVIAGEIGFYSFLFNPILKAEVAKDGRLTFRTVERIREDFSPVASFHSTLNACVNRSTTPLLLAEFGLGLKKAEEAELESKQTKLFELSNPAPKLRVLGIVRNTSCRNSRLQLHRNMQVPAGSCIYRLFFLKKEKSIV